MKKILKINFMILLLFLFNIDVKAVTIEEQIDEIINKISLYESQAFIDTHPVGSIYITTSTEENTAEKVSSKYGGTWEVYGADRVLKGTTSTSGQTGGSSIATLSASNIPSHAHSIPVLSGTTANTGSGYTIGHTCPARTTTVPNLNETVTAYYSGNIKTEYTSSSYYFYLRNGSSGNYGTLSSSVLTLSANHTHTGSDCYANSISGVQSHKHSVTTTASATGSTGSGQSFSILDPYITVYMYKRIS